MIKYILVWLLRLTIIFFIWLPIIWPAVYKEKSSEIQKTIDVVVNFNLLKNPSSRKFIENYIKEIFGKNRNIDFYSYGRKEQHLIYNFEELGKIIENSNNTVIWVNNETLWGQISKKFNEKIKKTKAFNNNFMYIDYSKIESHYTNKIVKKDDFIVINDLYIPSSVFLGEESIINIEVIGKSDKTIKTELILKSADEIIKILPLSFTPNANGLIKTNINVNANFFKVGTQSLTAELNSSEIVSYPLSMATTTLNVIHSKSTVLHVAYGPDWSLRNLRQRLKYWPNLDLLSYYILREMSSDASVSPDQMSLIEFPKEKLFGEQLENFHGIIMQNFPLNVSYLDSFQLSYNEILNMVKYVKNGGRLVIFTGPKTFEKKEKTNDSLFNFQIKDDEENFLNLISPCENTPIYKNDKRWQWESSLLTKTYSRYINAFNNLESFNNLTNCQLKKDAFILAHNKESKEPIVVSMPLGKGIILSILSTDWHIQDIKTDLLTEQNKNKKQKLSEATDTLMSFIIEFLQRRQDHTIRPPDLVGPRIYAQDKFLISKSRGFSPLGNIIKLKVNDKVLTANPTWLDFLEVEGLNLSDSISSELDIDNNSAKEKLVSLSLGVEGHNFSLQRQVKWPIIYGSIYENENITNPFLYENFVELNQKIKSKSNSYINKIYDYQPIIEVYPFLLALCLGLFALEQYLTHILWRYLFLKNR